MDLWKPFPVEHRVSLRPASGPELRPLIWRYSTTTVGKRQMVEIRPSIAKARKGWYNPRRWHSLRLGDRMANLLIFLPFLVPVIVANFSERHRTSPFRTDGEGLDRLSDLVLRYAPHALLVALDLLLLATVPLILLSQFLMANAGPQMQAQLAVQQPGFAPNWGGLVLVCLATALLALLPLIPAVRRGLARFLPIDADSLVHMTALAFAIYLIGMSLGQLALIGDLDNLTEAGLSLSMWDILMSGLPLAFFALAGVGWFIRRDGRGMLARLGLRWPTVRQLALAVGITLLLLALDAGVNLAWEKLDPTGYAQLERVTESLFGNLMTVGGAIVLGLSAGISEELLFRGALQPRLGLLLASILFAVGPVSYTHLRAHET